ncbi:hypothetical protein [Bradyrhizobium sp. USDA 4369]
MIKTLAWLAVFTHHEDMGLLRDFLDGNEWSKDVAETLETIELAKSEIVRMNIKIDAIEDQIADSDRCRPGFRDDLAHHSDLKSPTRSEMMSPTIPG